MTIFQLQHLNMMYTSGIISDLPCRRHDYRQNVIIQLLFFVILFIFSTHMYMCLYDLPKLWSSLREIKHLSWVE